MDLPADIEALAANATPKNSRLASDKWVRQYDRIAKGDKDLKPWNDLVDDGDFLKNLAMYDFLWSSSYQSLI